MLTKGGAPAAALATATLSFIGHGTSAVTAASTGCVAPSAKVALMYNQPTDVSLTKLWCVVAPNGPDGPPPPPLQLTLVTMEAERRETLTGVEETLMLTAAKEGERM